MYGKQRVKYVVLPFQSELGYGSEETILEKTDLANFSILDAHPWWIVAKEASNE